MATLPIQVRFTDDVYATRLDMVKALGTSLIDPMWNEVIKYRNSMKHIINVLDITRYPYFLTLTTKNVDKIETIPNLIARFANEFESLTGGELSQLIVKKDLLRSALKVIAKILTIEVSDISIDRIIERRAFSEDLLPIARYYEALEKLNFDSKIDEDFLANNLLILRGEKELTSFYRNEDIETESSKYLVSKEYEAAPVRDIEFLMSNLFNFLNNPDEPVLSKIVMTFYMFNFAKPFEKNNEELCMLVIKKIACQNAVIVPLENMFNLSNLSLLSKEVQKTRDLTYLFVPISNFIEETLTSGINKIIQTSGEKLFQAHYSVDQEKKEEQPVEQPKEKEEIKPVETKKEEKHVIKPVILQTRKIETLDKEEILDEKELKARVNDMLENDPYLKKNQAHFYVKHCVVGKYYTIQQYKKEEKCVYETARTSMDNLAKLGYYRREQIKNKFVYTPIEK